MSTSKKRSNCLISNSLEVFGDKWSLLIVRDLMFKKECTYGDFSKSEEKIATNILAARLLSLEENGIIKKLNHPDSKAKVLYRLTDKGIDLMPIIAEMNLWAEKYYPVSEERKAMLELIHKDKEAFVKMGMERLREV